jgi:two-component system, cell cycle response regulator CtrA
MSRRKDGMPIKEPFLSDLYGGMDEPELRIIDVFICKLHKKLANASEGKNTIETVWGRGCVLREPHEDEAKIQSRAARALSPLPVCNWRRGVGRRLFIRL